MDEKDHIDSWRERIILGAQPLDPEGATMPEPDFGPDIDMTFSVAREAMFSPSRLRVARKRRGPNKTQLADRIGVDLRSVTGYERGDYEPSGDTLGRIAVALRFPAAFFAGDNLHEPTNRTASFRSMARMAAPHRENAMPIVIEPLDPAKHDRAVFSCGIEQVDNFFRRTANKLTKAGNVRTLVMDGAEGEPIGFYATNVHAIDYTELPERFARARPPHGSIPAAYISMIGVDRRFQGRGYGGDLLVDCLARLAGAAEALGIAVVMLDVLDCGDPEKVAKRLALYTSYGFEPLPSNDLRLFLPTATIKKLAGQ